MAYDANDGMMCILVFYEALWLGEDQKTSLLNLNQVRNAGHEADDIPQFMTQGRSLHGIKISDAEHISFQLQGRSSCLFTRKPTQYELDHCEQIVLTSDEPWDPMLDDWEKEEEKFT